MDLELKTKHEKMIHGHTGGTFIEVVALVSLLQLSHILYSSICFAFPSLVSSPSSSSSLHSPKPQPQLSPSSSSSSRSSSAPTSTKLDCCQQKIVFQSFRRLSFDFILNFTPFILAVTALSDYVFPILYIVLLAIVVNFLYGFAWREPYLAWMAIDFLHKPRHYLRFDRLLRLELQYESGSRRVPYVSSLMSSLLLATCIAILAVDFQSFDRRFAKTEMYGWSLMDVGVGGFIAINGALSAESRLAGDCTITSVQRVQKTIRSSIPLILLGSIRLVTVKLLNYQEHITEYGLHWNFFFTIAFSKIFSSILCCWIQGRINLFTVSIGMALFHQYLLTGLGLTQYILSPDRSGLIAANKEGIISTLGSVCLYLFFVQYGATFMPKRTILSELVTLIKNILLIGAGSTLLMFTFHHLIEPVSRRETNFSYICFMISFITVNALIEVLYFILLQLIHRQACDLIVRDIEERERIARLRNTSPTNTKKSKPETELHPQTKPVNSLSSSHNPNIQQISYDQILSQYHSSIFESINKTGLFVFLFANLLTGLVNFSIDTLEINQNRSILILYGYSLCLTVFGWTMTKLTMFGRKGKKTTDYLDKHKKTS